MMNLDIQQDIQVDDDDNVSITYSPKQNLINHIVLVNKRFFIIDNISLQLIDNNDNRPYRRAIYLEVSTVLRRKNTILKFTTRMPGDTPIETIAILNDDVVYYGNLNKLKRKSQTITNTVSQGFFVNDIVTIDGNNTRKKIIAFKFDEHEEALKAITISASSTAANPVKLSYLLSKLTTIKGALNA